MAEIRLEGVTKSFAAGRSNKTRGAGQANETQRSPVSSDKSAGGESLDNLQSIEIDPGKESANRQNAVDSLDLFVEDGEFLVLVGPSGCGKTTTLRLIAGLEQCDTGQIFIGGRNVTTVSPSRRDVAMVFQNYALYPHMTVYKNMAFGLEVKYGRGVFDVLRRLFRPSTVTQKDEQRRGIESRVGQAAKILGIESLLNRRPHQLSGGERQRVALGRAIVRDPAAFLFDEPLSNLDAKLRSKMRLELGQLHLKLKATSVYVTHDQTEAMSLGDRIAVMNHGRIQQIGSPSEVYNRPSNPFVASFIGPHPMNLMMARWEKEEGKDHSAKVSSWGTSPGGFSLPLPGLKTGGSFNGNANDRRWILGVRPEHLQSCPLEDSWWQATIQAIDRLGDHCVLHVQPINNAIGENDHNNKKGVTGINQKENSQLAEGEAQLQPQWKPSVPSGTTWWTIRITEKELQKHNYQVGASIGLRTEGDKLHFFDALTGQNLRDG